VGSGRETETRFAFGENWADFAQRIDDERVRSAVESLRERLGDLSGLRFLDVGCGSGLFSLAAVLLGAEVSAFDYDAASVRTTQRLLQAHAPGRPWTVEQGNILDADLVDRLGEWDVVYSWGVLHHTGDMYQAWENVSQLVVPRGQLFISIYNDQGALSARWARVKRTYNRLPKQLRTLFVLLLMVPIELRDFAGNALGGHPEIYARAWTHPQRGMTRWHGFVDWVGGFPFEVAKPEDVLEFFRGRGYQLDWMRTCGGGIGCNEFVLSRSAEAGSARPRSAARQPS
jgi:2-polyprenyl-3-methyl-5-hydroxy-6-metoxy-1,4-benzoquinol methylase